MIRTVRLVVVASALCLMAACQPLSQGKPQTADTDALNIVAQYQAGRVAYEGEKYDKAAVIFSQVVSNDPNYLNALMNWGVSLSRGGKPLEAIPKFQQVLAREPNNAAAFYNWGVALERMRKHNEALDKYQRAVQLNPELLTPALERYIQRRTASAPDSTIGPNPPAPTRSR